MLSYPLIPPASPTSQKIVLSRNSVIGRAASPFSGVQQVQEFPGEWWGAQVSLPPMNRADAEKWIAFLFAARGGTFYLGDTSVRSLFAPGSMSGAPAVNGGSQSGRMIALKSLISNSLIASAGDYFEHGAGDGGATFVTVVPDGVHFHTATISFQALAAAVIGQSYTTSVRIEYASASGITLSDNLGGSVSSATAGPDDIVVLRSIAVNTNPYKIQISIPGDVLLSMYAWDARCQRSELNENLIPVANRSLIGWTTSGTGASSTAVPGYAKRLYKVMADARSGGDSKALVDVFPSIRANTMTDGDIIVPAGGVAARPVARGVFRLADNTAQFSVDQAMVYGISFNAVEAI